MNLQASVRFLENALPIMLIFSIPLSTAMTTVCMGLLVLTWLLAGRTTLKLQSYWQHPITPTLLLFFGVYFFGCFYTIASEDSMMGRLSDGLRLCLIPILIFYLDTRRRVHYAMIAFIAAMTITLFASVLKMHFGVPIGMKYELAAEVFKNRIATNFFMAMAAFFTFYLGFRLKSGRVYPFLLGFSMLYYVFFMSMGRVGYVAIFVLLLYLSYEQYGRKGLLLGFLGLCATFAFLYHFSEVFHMRLDALVQDYAYYKLGLLEQSSLGSRLQFYQTSLELIQQHPLLGWGTGSFGQAYQNLSEGAYLFTDNPHNEFLRVTVEHGLLGLGLLLALLAKQWQLMSGLVPEWRTLCRGCFLIFIVGCFFNSWLTDFSESYFYIAFSALALFSINRTQSVQVRVKEEHV